MVELLYRDLGRMGYGECWDLQRLLFARLLDSKSSSGQNSVTLSDSQRADILEWDKRGALTEDMELRDDMTFYVRHGDWIASVCIYAAVLSLLYYIAYRTRRRNHLVD
jgi:apolipoprotein N-acyltransferase